MVEYDCSTDNNIILRDDDITNFAVFRDDNPLAPDDERHKAIAKGPKTDGRATTRGLTSPDGFQWKVIDIGDDIERVVTWHGSANLGNLAGCPVRLRVTSANCADFYSVRFRQSA